MMTAGYREHASGLIVPEDVSRKRIVFTKDETRLIQRALKLLGARGLATFFGCPERSCRRSPVQRVELADGSESLRCDCTDWVLSKACR